MERHEVKQKKRVTFPPHGAHMDTAVLWKEGYPNTLGCCSILSKAGWTGKDAMDHSPAPDPCCVAGLGDIPRPSSKAPQTP